MAMEMDNRERLRAAGLLADTELPAHYYEAIDSLEPHEIDVLLSVQQRLLDAGVPVVPLSAPIPGKAQGVIPL